MMHTPTDNIQITTIYSPSTTPSIDLIQKIMNRHDKTIITGDFNSRHVDFGHDKNNKQGNQLVNIINKNKYTQLNDNQSTYTNDITGKQDVKYVKTSKLTRIWDRITTSLVHHFHAKACHINHHLK